MGSWLPWRKLASNPPGLDWPALPWQARGLYALLLGLADDAGVIRLGKLGLQSLAGALRASWPELEPHFDALVTTGWAEVQAGAVLLPHFEDSQRASTTAERVAQYRERARNAPVTPEKRDGNEKLPNSNEDVTKSYPDKNRKEEIRSEENRSDTLPKTPAPRDVSAAPQGTFALTAPPTPAAPPAPAAAKTKKERKPKEPKEPKPPKEPTAGSVIFAAYREAFLQRYGVEPPRDSRTNRHFANVARNATVGRSAACSEPDAIKEACAVAARYVRHPDAHYAKQQHPPAMLERDWHKLVTEYRTGRTVTGTHARDSERMESNPILAYAAEVRALEEAERRRQVEVVDVEQ